MELNLATIAPRRARSTMRTLIFVVIISLVLAVASLALAGNSDTVYADCGPSGIFKSKTNGYYWAYHTHDGTTQSWSYSGMQWRTGYWGLEDYTESAYVRSDKLADRYATCTPIYSPN